MEKSPFFVKNSILPSELHRNYLMYIFYSNLKKLRNNPEI